MQDPILGIGHNSAPRGPACPPWLVDREAPIARRESPGATADRTRSDKSVLRFDRRTSLSAERPTMPNSPCGHPAVPDLEQALVHPSAVFASPEDVVRHPLLSLDCKREILRRWAWDEHLIEIAQDEGMPEGKPSRLPEVRSALRALGTEWRPDPAAPSMPAVHLDRKEMALAA